MEEYEQAEAVIPIAGWAVSIIGGIIIDIAIDMGVKFIDKKAKEGFQSKILQKIFSKNANSIKINELKPTKTNAGKWALKVPKWLLALITGAVTKEILDTKLEDETRVEENASKDFITHYDSSIYTKPTDPFYNTGVKITGLNVYGSTVLDKKIHAYFNTWVNYKLQPVSYAQKTSITMSPYKDFPSASTDTFYINGGYNGVFHISRYTGVSELAGLITSNSGNAFSTSRDNSGSYYGSIYVTRTMAAFPAFEVYLRELENNAKKIYYANGVLVGKYEGLIQLPDVIPDNFDYSILPPSIQSDRDYIFEIKDENVLVNENWTTINEGDIFEWNIIEQDIVNQGDTIYNIYITYDYNPNPNPDYEISQEEQDKIDSLPTDDGTKPPSNGGGNVDVGVIDGSLTAYVKNAYEYATSLINTSVEGLKSLATGAKELTALFGVFMSWLPKEIVVLMSSGLGLMIGLRVFRK